jgi:hypothetical protein
VELDNGSEGSETPEKQNISAALNVSRLIRSIRRSRNNIEKALMILHIIEMKRNKGIRNL